MNEQRVDMGRVRSALQRRLLRLLPRPGVVGTVVPGLRLHRFDSDATPRPLMYEPVLVVIAQGKKWTRIGAEERIYDERHCFVAGLHMPVTSGMLEISQERPFLSLSLALDRTLLTALSAEIPPPDADDTPAPAALLQEMDADMLDAALRLVETLDRPETAPALAPLIVRELHVRLLAGPFGNRFRRLFAQGSREAAIAEAVAWIAAHFREPLRIEDLARRCNMAPSTFHKHFKEITTVSPLQYQKRARLAEAQRLLLQENADVARAAFAVGYESASQFSREYKRLFGAPPRRDVEELRAGFLP